MAYTLFDGKLDDEEPSGYTLFKGEIDEPVRRRDVTPFKVDIQQPRPAPVRPTAAPVAAPMEDFYQPGGEDFGAAIMAVAEPKRTSVLEGLALPPQAPLIDRRGAPISEEKFTALKQQYDAANPKERQALLQNKGFEGSVFQSIDKQYRETDAKQLPTLRAFDTRREVRRDAYLAQGRDIESADALAAQDAATGVEPQRFSQAKPSDFDFANRAEYKRPEGRMALEETEGLIRARTIQPTGFEQLVGAGKAVGGKVTGTFQSAAAGAWQLIGDTLETTGDLAGSAQLTDLGARLSGGNAVQQKSAKAKLEAIGENPNAALNFIETGVAGAINNFAPYLVNPALGVTAAVAQTFAEEYGNGKAAGQTMGQALPRAAFMAFAEWVGERASLPTPFIKGFKDLVKGMPADEIMPVFARYLVKENLSEQVTTAMQFGTDKWAPFGLTPNAGLNDYLKAVGDTFYQTTAQTLVMGGAGRVAAPIARKLSEVSPERAFADAFAGDVAATQFAPSALDQYARRALDVQSYDENIIRPGQAARVQQDQADLQSSTTAADAAAAADNLAGSLGEMLVPGNAVTPIIPPPDITGTITPPLPGVNLETEQQFGLDKLRINPQPAPVETRTFTAQEMGAMPIRDRRALTNQFDQTENEDGTTTFTAKSGAAPSTQVVPTPGAEQTLGTAPVRDVSNQPVLDDNTVRADAQRSLDDWATKNNQAIPARLDAAPEAETRAVATVANLLGSQFGTRVVAFHDTQPSAVQGVAVGGTAFVNTANVFTNIAKVSLHELKHTIEQIAFTEKQAGLTDTAAQKFTAQIEGIFDDMTDEGKRAYLVNFLHKDELAALDATPDIKESRIQELMQSPVLRSEMTADFMGNRATDKRFWADVAKADPGGFKGFVQKWVSVIDNLMGTLRGKAGQTKTESAKVDQYVRDLAKAKMVAREALIAYRQGTLQQFESAPAASLRQGEVNAQTSVAAGSENLPGATTPSGPGFSEDGGGPVPNYGTARAGAISVLARHYSTTPRQTLSGAYYGQGLKGAERDRLDRSTDPRIKNRVYFYVDQGAGIRPESGVGGYAHEARLDNIYDPQTRLIKPQADSNAFESAVINAGFDGYIAPFGNNQSAVVLLGLKHKAVPVRAIGQPKSAALPAEAAPTTLKKGLLSREASQVDTGNIPGSRMRMGTLEIPAAQVDAANAEMERIGSQIRFSAKQKTVAEGRIRRTVEELVTAADSQSSWRTWYTRHEKTIADMFGEDAALFQKLLSATSQATGVKGNVTLALKAYDQLRAGQPFTGYLPAVIKNLDRIANDEKLAGAKILQYGQANEGDVDAIAVDRHIAMLFFNTKTPNPRQIASAKKRIKAIAARLEWEPRQVQAALWAFNQVRLGTDPAKVESYDKILEARADAIATLRAQYGRGAGGGVQTGGAVGAGNQKRQGPVPVAKTGTELELNGVKFSAKQRDLTDIPTITFRDLVGKKVMGIKADLTTAGVSYTGIDGSQLEFPVEMLGGPNFVRLPENTKTNVVWAVRGGATLSKIMAKVNESDYVLVHAMNDNSHLTNATVSQAYIQTVEAYLRDKRITPANLLALDKIVQSSENKNSLPDFPGFESPGILGYIDGLSFDQRGALAKMLETKQAQALGLPNLDRFRRETMDAEYAGYRQGDTMLVIEIDKKNPTVKLGEEGTKMHPSYPLGLRGRVVGKLAKGVNYELIFRDYFENKVPTIGNKEAGAWYAFDRVLPVQEITSEIADALGEGGYENITSSRQAQASLALANNQWLESGKTKATGGISNTEFVDALRANEGVAALTLYDADEVKAGVKDGSFKIYQLGKEGGNKGIQIFFGLKRGKPWYADMIDGIKDNEVEVVSVINNEPGAPGVAIPAIITKAIAEGATVLDAFAVKSARFPDGFLPEMYGQFGFETIGTIPFDASYYDANKLSDLKAFWAKGGWKEADGYPDVVVMRWKGNNADRQSAIERYVRTGETRVSGDVPRYTRDATGEPGEQRNPPRGGEGRARGGDNGQAGGDQGASNAAPVVRRAYGSLQELANLSAGDIRNLGLNPEDVARLRNQLAPGATPDSEAIFAGLEKRGLAKSKAETALANHPNSKKLKYIQENFNDILIQLEDADKVKINCD